MEQDGQNENPNDDISPADELVDALQPEGDRATKVTEHSRGGGLLPHEDENTTKEEMRPSVRESPRPRTASRGDLNRSQSPSRIGRIYRKTSKDIRLHSRHESYRGDGSTHETINVDEEADATWKDVMVACCCHSRQEWATISVGVAFLLLLLYFFLLGLELLGTSFKVVGGCTAGSLLGSDTNPLASVMIGIIATAILQSSSTTTAIIVTLVSGGLDVKQGIYMVMGANVGTSITGMAVSMAHMGDGEELQRAFSGAALLYVFNFFTLVVLLPIEVATGYLYKLTKAMLPSEASEEDGEAWEGPIKKIVSPLGNKIIIANKKLIEDVSNGDASCSSYYPVDCKGNSTCPTAGLIACDKDTGKCPVFFQEGATKKDDTVSGWVCLAIALFLLIVCLIGLVALLRKMLLGASTRIIYKATNINPYIAMCIGCGVTVLVQSSSITTSALVPLAGVGVLKLENMYPLILGSDVGTTFTALMAAMVSSEVESLQIALVHLFFNLTGVVMWYPIPFMRNLVLKTAVKLGKITMVWRKFPLVFIVLMFFVLPLLLLGISACFEKKTTGFTALGVFLLILVVGGILYFLFWWRFRNGNVKCRSCIKRRQRRAAATEHLADDMDYLKCDMEYVKNEIGRLKDYAGLPTMEEGRPPARPEEPEVEGVEGFEEPDQVSLYHSYQSKPWQDVLAAAGRSVKSSLHSMVGSSAKW